MQAPRPLTSAPALRQLACVLGLGLGLGAGLSAPALAQSSAPAASQSGMAPAAEAAEIQRLIREGQHTQALKLIDDSLSRNPKDPQMRFRRGVALSMLDRKGEALAVFQKLIEDQPDMPAPYNNMAVIYGAQGEYEKARAALERAIRTNPAYATAYQNLGDVYAQLASQAYSKALQLDKSDATVPPKLALLRELTSGPSGTPAAAPAAVAAVTPAPAPKREPAATVVAAAPNPAPPPKPAVVASPPAVTPAPKPTPAPAAPASPPPSPPSPSPAASSATASAPPAAATAPAPVAATKPAPAAQDKATAEIETAVKAWAAAWSRRDMNAYYAAYTPEFSGQSGSRKSWEQERRDRIAPRKQIKVELADLQITVNGDRATARFRQSYESDSLAVVSRKTLQLSRSASGKWQIRQESAGT